MSRRVGNKKNLSPEAQARQKAAQAEWRKQNYDYVVITAKKGLKEQYMALAEAHGLTLSTYVRNVLAAEFEKTFGKKINE